MTEAQIELVPVSDLQVGDVFETPEGTYKVLFINDVETSSVGPARHIQVMTLSGYTAGGFLRLPWERLKKAAQE